MGMLIFGIVLTTLGAILPSVMDQFHVDRATAGTLFSLVSIGILVGSLIFGPIVDRRGYKGLLAVSTVLILIGLEGVAWAQDFGWLRVSVFVIGVGGGVINGGTNALVADISESGRSAGLSLLGVFFGIGAFGLPFVSSFLFARFAYSEILAAMGVIVLVPLFFFGLIRFPAPKHAVGFPLKEGLRLITDPTIVLLGFMLFMQSGIEITTGGWSAAYFRDELGLDTSRAVFLLSFFWIGLMLARLYLGSWLKTGRPAVALFVSIGIAIGGSVLLVASQEPVLAAIGIFVTGAGLAAGFPVALGYVGDLHPGLSGTAFGIVMVMALTGGSLMPYVAGVVGQSYGLRASFLLVPASLCVIAVVFAITERRLRGAPAADD
jgi:fucose permease